MFKFAQSLVRHKIGVVAVIAFAVVLFSRDGEDKTPKPSSPWSAQAEVAPVISSGSEEDGLVGKAVTAASDYVGEATGINPAELKENTVDNWNNTADAMKQANER